MSLCRCDVRVCVESEREEGDKRRKGGVNEGRVRGRKAGRQAGRIVEHDSSGLGLCFSDKKCSMYKKQCSGGGVI